MEYVLGGLLIVLVGWFVWRKLKKSNLPAEIVDKAETIAEDVKEAVTKPRKNRKNKKNLDDSTSV